MPTEMGSGSGNKLHVESDKLRSPCLLVTFHLSLATSAHERMSVFTCVTDDCPLAPSGATAR